MARRQVTMNEIVEMIYQWHQGARFKAIWRSLGFDRNTIRKYIGPAQAAGVQRRAPFPQECDLVMRLKEVQAPVLNGAKIIRIEHLDFFDGLSSFMQFQKEPKRKGQTISSPAFLLNVYRAFQKIQLLRLFPCLSRTRYKGDSIRISAPITLNTWQYLLKSLNQIRRLAY